MDSAPGLSLPKNVHDAMIETDFFHDFCMNYVLIIHLHRVIFNILCLVFTFYSLYNFYYIFDVVNRKSFSTSGKAASACGTLAENL